jgi:hypothetical protein
LADCTTVKVKDNLLFASVQVGPFSIHGLLVSVVPAREALMLCGVENTPHGIADFRVVLFPKTVFRRVSARCANGVDYGGGGLDATRFFELAQVVPCREQD